MGYCLVYTNMVRITNKTYSIAIRSRICYTAFKMKETALYQPPEVEERGTNFEILSPRAFMQDFGERATGAKKRVWLETMHFENDPVFRAFGNTLQTASVRGVDSRLTIDYFSHMVVGGKLVVVPCLRPSKQRDKFDLVREKHTVLENIRNKGVTVTLTNKPEGIKQLLPQIGRNHTKLAIVDDTAYIGGLNLAEEEFRRKDFMMRITDKRIVAGLAECFVQVNENRPARDKVIRCTKDTRILMDAGKYGSSIILDTAVDMVQQAMHDVSLVTQITPDATMRRALHDASLTKDVELIVSGNKTLCERSPRVLDTANRIMGSKRMGKTRRMDYPRWVHAKMLLTDRNYPGKAKALFGSHNLLTSSVKSGTQEIALETTNPEMVAQLSEYYESLKENAVCM